MHGRPVGVVANGGPLAAGFAARYDDPSDRESSVGPLVERNVEDGTMKVYFNDMKKPYMTAKDKMFAWGQVGIGTFDDHGNFDDVVLRGVKVEKRP